MKEVRELSENISDKLPSNMMVIGIASFIAGTVGLINGNNGLIIFFVIGIALIAKASKDNGRKAQGDDK